MPKLHFAALQIASAARHSDRVSLNGDQALLATVQIGMEWGTTGTGGVDRVFEELARCLPSHGISFNGVVTGAPSLEAETQGLVRSAALSDAGMVTRLRGMRSAVLDNVKKHHASLIASHFALYALPVADRLRRMPHVVHFHGPWAAESLQENAASFPARVKHSLERNVYATGDRVIVLSEAFARVVTESYGVSRDRVRIVPGSVDLARFLPVPERQEARRRLGWHPDRPTFVAVRRLTARMGLDRLLEAMATVVQRYPEAQVKIGGKGPLREALEAQAKALGIADHVEFLGFVRDEDLPLVYAAADANVVPTLAWEGFGLVAAEALAAGTPSLVTPVGGLPEVVAALSQHLLFPSSEPGAIAESLLAVLSGARPLPDREACQSYAAQMFSSDRMAQDVAAVYREAVA